MIPIDQAGVPTYDELVLVVREDEARTRGQDLRAFMQALTQGEQAGARRPAAAAALLVRANPSLEAKLQLESIEQTLPAALPAPRATPTAGRQPAAWAAFGSWMTRARTAQPQPQRAGLQPFTNEFLPGPGHLR